MFKLSWHKAIHFIVLFSLILQSYTPIRQGKDPSVSPASLDYDSQQSEQASPKFPTFEQRVARAAERPQDSSATTTHLASAVPGAALIQWEYVNPRNGSYMSTDGVVSDVWYYPPVGVSATDLYASWKMTYPGPADRFSINWGQLAVENVSGEPITLYGSVYYLSYLASGTRSNNCLADNCGGWVWLQQGTPVIRNDWATGFPGNQIRAVDVNIQGGSGPGGEEYITVHYSAVPIDNPFPPAIPDLSTISTGSDACLSASYGATQGTAGMPINTRTGGYEYTVSDISVPTSAGELTFQREYTSLSVDNPSALSAGWTHNHDSRLIFPADPEGQEDTVLFKAHTANKYLFTINGDGTYSPYPGLCATLWTNQLNIGQIAV